MLSYRPQSSRGFSLIEILLVMVIISIFLYAMIGYMQQKAETQRVTRTGWQMQQILNAGLAYYVENGQWPSQLSALEGKYLPSTPLTNSWGQPYQIYRYPVTTTNPRLFYVYTTVAGAAGSTSAATAARRIAGLLPLSYVSARPGVSGLPPAQGAANDCDKGNCMVVGMVNIPSQNINRATAVNFAGVYRHGSCVPVPRCAMDSTDTFLKPQIFVVPISVKGTGFWGATLAPDREVYPLVGFTAYALGDNGNATPTGKSPPLCKDDIGKPDPDPCRLENLHNDANTSAYWRVCLQMVSQSRDSNKQYGSSAWMKQTAMMAITRCAPRNEAAGSVFSDGNASN